MGFLRTLGLIILGFFLGIIIMALIAALVLVVPNPLIPSSNNRPFLAMNEPAGLLYNGPRTTAIAGYYCVYGVSVAGNTGSLRGYSVQLNAQLSNGYWVQAGYVPFYVNGVEYYGPQYDVFYGNQPITLGPSQPITAPPCGWLVIAVSGDTVYFGYSQDGYSIDWLGSYVMNSSAVIMPSTMTSSLTNLVIAGPGAGEGVSFNYLNTSLALYYWGNGTWLPATVRVAGNGETGEWVSNAYVFVSNNCASVTWPAPSNFTECPQAPSFSP